MDAAAMVMLKHLFDRLATLEARSGSASPADTPPTLPLFALKSQDLDLPPGKPEAIALDTLSLIFEAIFDSADLPDAIKAAMARLQIPLFKLALIDQTLFANDRHPARRLINGMARAAIGLPQDSGSEHPVCRQISRLTTAVRDTLAQQGVSLDPQLAELDALITARDQAITLAAEKHVQLLIEHENREYATQVAGTWLRASLSRTSSPPIAAFLEEYWLRVMIAAASDGGTHGLRWQQDSSTGDQLIWSVLPKETAEERKRLAGMASSLVTRIGVGLDQIGVSVEERSPFLNALFDLQTAALRSRAAPPAALSETLPGNFPQAPAANPATGSGPVLLELDGRRVLCLAMPTDARSSHRLSPADWQVGDWLRFSVPDRGPHCGLCCWQSQGSGRVLFFNPDWGYAVAMHRASLDQQLRSGGAQIVSRIATFDAAAERALSRLDPR